MDVKKFASVLSSRLLGEQTHSIVTSCTAPLPGDVLTLPDFFAPPTATDGKLDDSSPEKLNVWIAEV